ncbi:MAG: hypothetical protein U1E18_24060 [Brevundimonas sp.]|uniref:hypothetical protein n=1 Tax=Brevundimonas sp. TaxID=1871086 RepID=UPI002ABBFCD6|nr:hypothetical protein [Brevundimonas sp.]MDZ4112654.1 hypothetical protein [Brevundimonas sp.]
MDHLVSRFGENMTQFKLEGSRGGENRGAVVSTQTIEKVVAKRGRWHWGRLGESGLIRPPEIDLTGNETSTWTRNNVPLFVAFPPQAGQAALAAFDLSFS